MSRPWSVRIVFRLAPVLVALMALAWPAVGQNKRRARSAPPPRNEGVPIPKPPVEYRSPVTRPTTIMQGNGGSFSHTDVYSRYAWDFTLRIGSPVVATRAGLVRVARADSRIGGNDRARFANEANMVIVQHFDGTATQYLHFRHGTVRVETGDWVVQGELLGLSGDTGYVTDPHLHYSAIRFVGRQSVASTFRDFKSNGGVPREGDRVRAARKPTPSQKTIDAYRRIERASRAAERGGWIALALRLCARPPVKRVPADYFYEAVRAARRTRLIGRVGKRLAALAAGTLADRARLDARRMVAILRGGGVPEVASVLKDLEAALAKIPAAERLDARDVTAIAAWCEGLEREAERNTRDALARYGGALKRAGDVMRPLLREAIARVMRTRLAEDLAAMKRLVYEAGRATSVHRSRLKDAARATWKSAQRAVRDWKRIDRDAKADADGLLRGIQAQYRAFKKAKS